MPACTPRGCNCALTGSAVQGGSGDVGDPYLIEAGGVSLVTEATRPASPSLGRTIVETDTDRGWYWDGSAWRIIYDPAPYTHVQEKPGSQSDFVGTGTLWTFADVTVPDWATVALATAKISGFLDQTGLSASFRLFLEGIAEGDASYEANWNSVVGTPARRDVTMFGRYPGLTPGATNVTPTIDAGAFGTIRIDTSTVFQLRIDWMES